MQRPLPGLNRGNFVREATAGITLLAISVPLNIGYAQIAGLPASAGLYALIVPTIIYALLISSRQVVASPDAAAAALVFSSLMGLGVAPENFVAMAAAQALLSGLMFFAASFLKLGFIANFLSKPILVGFVGGLALEILLSQAAKMVGVKIDSGGEFVENLWALLIGLGGVNLFSAVLSAGALMVLLLGRHFLPAIPWALVVLVLATVATVMFSLEGRGVSVLGEVPGGPPQFSIPRVDLTAWLTLIPSALALTMVTIAEGLMIIRSYGEKNGYSTQPNKDLFAFGAANIASGISGSFAMGSSTSRTAAMDQAGSRTQLPSIVMAAGTFLLLLFGTALLAQIPSPAIGAVVAVAVFKLLGIGEMRELWRSSRSEFAIGVACFVGVLLVGPLGGLFLAFVLSLVNLVRRAANPSIDVLKGEDDPTVSLTEGAAEIRRTAPGIAVVRMAAPIFFANGTVLADRIMELRNPTYGELHVVVLDLEAVSDIDVTGAEALAGIIARLQRDGISLAYSRLRPHLRVQLESLNLLNKVEEFSTNREAVAALSQGFNSTPAASNRVDPS
ncbi:sodium-independent anion transporter [Arthrobacter psychrolactophilus]|uniref:Sodium-independent anion transporter n=1 Tax=Arthrobacter psychrolactophilus TaxID=92442 RepID=A0A2V5IRR0_9MICC|nr:SulP family inorganic anion transporter [Arthrobacter psychrolactophilus]PYI38052.1 sodium-independent anion transporter [Arthrobacter psychrolactophilus]